MNKAVLAAVALTFATTAYAQSSTSTTAAPSAATVSASATAVGAKPVSPIKISYVAENSAGVASANAGDEGAFVSLQHFGVAYKLDDKRSIQYRQYFGYNYTQPDANDTHEWEIADHVFRYTDAELFATVALPLTTEFRLYIGGNEFAREVGAITLRNDTALAQAWAKTTIEYGLSTRLYGYTQDSAGQTAFRLLPSIDISHQINPMVAPFTTVYTDHRWLNGGSGIATVGPTAGIARDPSDNRDELNIDAGARLAFGKNVSLAVYLETTTNLQTSSNLKDNSVFDQDNTNYMADLSVSL